MEMKLQPGELQAITLSLTSLGELFESEEHSEDGHETQSQPELIETRKKNQITISSATVTVVLFAVESILASHQSTNTLRQGEAQQRAEDKPAHSSATTSSIYQAMLSSCHCQTAACRAFLIKPYLYRCAFLLLC